MDSTFGQIAIPLAAAAGSAFSPYVARGIGPGLAALGAMGGFAGQKQRQQMQALELQKMQDDQAARQGLATSLADAVNAGQPMPRGQSLSAALGMPSSLTPEEQNPPQELPAGALAATPYEASMIKGLAPVNPQVAFNMASQVADRQRLPKMTDVAGFKPPPGSRYSGKTQEGVDFIAGEPKTAEEAYLAEATDPADRKRREQEIIKARYGDKSITPFESWRQRPGNENKTEADYEQAMATARARGERAGSGKPATVDWEPSAADRRRAEIRATVQPTPENGLDRPYIDPDLYDAAIEQMRPGKKGSAPAPSSKPQYVTKDGKMGYVNGRWVKLSK